MNSLFRHDRLVATNTTRATFTGWPDRLIAAIMLLAAVTVVRSWYVDRSWMIAAWMALVAGTVIAIGAGRLIATRLAFHAIDGLLAVEALTRWRSSICATRYGKGRIAV